MTETGKLLVVDACVAINLVASRRWTQIFIANGCVPLMPRIALKEVLYVFDAEGERQEASLNDLEATRELTSCDLDTEQLVLMLQLAAELGQGEAAAIAVAKGRGLSLATDDRVAQKVAQMKPGLLTTTPQLVRGWAETEAPDQAEVVEALKLIETRASFRPGSHDPAFEWWRTVQRSGGH